MGDSETVKVLPQNHTEKSVVSRTAERKKIKQIISNLSICEFENQRKLDETLEEIIAEPSVPKPKKEKIRKKLPSTLTTLFDEAEVCFKNGDLVKAETICRQLIRQVPTVSEPYLMLAKIYDDNPDKSFQFDWIAAHLRPNDADQWDKLGKLSGNFNNLKQANICYAKAILANPSNINLHLKRIDILESMNKKKLVAKAKFRALNYMKEEHLHIMKPFAVELAKLYFDEKDVKKAKDCLQVVFQKCPNSVDVELVNFMLEVSMNLKEYIDSLQLLVEYCNIQVEIVTNVYDTGNDIEEKSCLESYFIPDTVVIDLYAKFIICLIHLGVYNRLDELLVPMLSDDGVEQFGDLYLDIAEALMEQKHHKDALKLLTALIKSKNFSLPAIWFRHAECLTDCGSYEQAVDSYKTAIELEPDYILARERIFGLLTQLNRVDEALTFLGDETSET